MRQVTYYARHLWYVLIRLQQQQIEAAALESSKGGATSQPLPSQPSSFVTRVDPNPYLIPHTERLVLSKVVWFSLKTMLRMNIDTVALGKKAWDMERLIGSVGLTPLTHPLTFHILETKANSINVGRTLILLNL